MHLHREKDLPSSDMPAPGAAPMEGNLPPGVPPVSQWRPPAMPSPDAPGLSPQEKAALSFAGRPLGYAMNTAAGTAQLLKNMSDIGNRRVAPDDPRLVDTPIQAIGALMGRGLGAPGEGIGVMGGRGGLGAMPGAQPFKYLKPNTKWLEPGETAARFHLDNEDGSVGDGFTAFAGRHDNAGKYDATGKNMELLFSNDKAGGYTKPSFKATGGYSSRDLLQIMSTMHSFAKDVLTKNPDIENLTFSANAGEPKRVQLYRILANKFSSAPEEYKEGNFITFKLPRSTLKGLEPEPAAGPLPVRPPPAAMQLLGAQT